MFFTLIKKRDHLHTDTVQEPGLVNGYVYRMVPGFQQEIGPFRRFDAGWQEDWSAAGSADAEITVPPVDIIDNFGSNDDFTMAGAVMGVGMHDAITISRQG